MEQENLPVPAGPEGAVGPSRFSFADGMEEEAGPSVSPVKRYLGAVIRYRWLVLLVAAAGIAAGIVASGRTRLTYPAQVTLWLQAQQTDRNAESQGPIQSGQLLEDNAWVELLGSFAVLDSVVFKERLYVRYGAQDTDVLGTFQIDSMLRPGAYRLRVSADGRSVDLRTEEGVSVETVRPGEAIGRQLGFIWQPPASALTAGREVPFSVVLPRAAAVNLHERLAIDIPRRGEAFSFMSVKFSSSTPERASSVLNSIADQFVSVSAELKRARLVELRDILASQVEYARANLEDAEYQLNNFLVQTITLPSQPATPVNPGTEQTRTGVLSTFYDLKIERDNVERDREAIERALGDGTTSLSIDALSSVAAARQSPELSQALAELTTKRAEMRALMRLYTMEHRTAQNAAEDLENLETRVVPQLARNVMAEMTARMGVLDGMISSRSQELREIPPRAIDEARFQRNVAIAAALYNDVSQRYENARLATATTTPDVSILSRATPSQIPTSDTRLRILAMFIVGGLGAGIGLAVLLELLDKRVRYPEQISSGMRLSILGAIPDLTTRRIGFGTVQPDASELVEALRSVRLSLSHAHGAAGPIMVTITSPGAGDGKTFLTSNLAATFAELGKRVLVIDGDTRRGSLHRVLNLDRKPGLTDYLINGAQVMDVIRPTTIALMDIIPCGTRSPKAPELLSSPRMGDLLAEIRPRYDVILVDSPPLGAGIDPLVLSTITGSVVLVMRTGKTDRALAEAKLAVLDRLPVRVLGAVMNGITTDAAFRYYSYMPGYEAGLEGPDEPDRYLQPG